MPDFAIPGALNTKNFLEVHAPRLRTAPLANENM